MFLSDNLTLLFLGILIHVIISLEVRNPFLSKIYIYTVEGITALPEQQILSTNLKSFMHWFGTYLFSSLSRYCKVLGSMSHQLCNSFVIYLHLYFLCSEQKAMLRDTQRERFYHCLSR